MAVNCERRTFTGVAVRATDGNDFALVGVAASYGVDSAPIPGSPAGTPFVERIQRGAFARALRQKQDVKCLKNHDHNYILGRTKNGTLQLHDTDEGLAFRCQLDKRNSMHGDLYASVKRGDIDSCSFAFAVVPGGEKWSNDYRQRTLTDVDLFDVSAVTFPAYPTGTKVDARNLRSGLYTLTQDWKQRHNAALAKLAPVIAADKSAIARQEYLDALAESRAEGWDV